MNLQKEFDLTYIFVARDRSVVKHTSDRVTLYDEPRHPYTNSLGSAIPIPDPQRGRERQRIVLTGDVPSPANPPQGCTFHTRCRRAQDYCKENVPPLEKQGDFGHFASCLFPVTEGQSVTEKVQSTLHASEE